MTFKMPTEQTVYVVGAQGFDKSVAHAKTWGEIFDIDRENCSYKCKLHAIDAEESKQ